jgi:hypothetical protein
MLHVSITALMGTIYCWCSTIRGSSTHACKYMYMADAGLDLKGCVVYCSACRCLVALLAMVLFVLHVTLLKNCPYWHLVRYSRLSHPDGSTGKPSKAVNLCA